MVIYAVIITLLFVELSGYKKVEFLFEKILNKFVLHRKKNVFLFELVSMVYGAWVLKRIEVKNTNFPFLNSDFI